MMRERIYVLQRNDENLHTERIWPIHHLHLEARKFLLTVMNCVLEVLRWKEKISTQIISPAFLAFRLQWSQHELCAWIRPFETEAFCKSTSLSTTSIFRWMSKCSHQLLVLALTLTGLSEWFELKEEANRDGIQSPHLGSQDGCLTGHTYQLSTAGSQHVHTPTVRWSD